VRLDPATGRLEGTARTTLRHHRRHPLVFFLNQGLAVTGVELDGRQATMAPASGSLPYVKGVRAYRVVTEGHEPRVVTSVTVRYAGRLPERMAQVNGIGADLVELALYAGWYPIFQGTARLTNDLEVHLPAGFKVVGRGKRISAWQVDPGQRVERWRAEIPGHDITLLASPHFRQIRRGPIRLVITSLPGPLARRILDLAHRALSHLRAAHGKPVIDTLRIVLSPRGGWGYSRPGLIVASEEKVRAADDEEALRERVLGVVHEIGHLWWHLADASTPDDWINEALAEYCALRVTGLLFGSTAAAQRRERYLEHLGREPPPISIVATRSDSRFRQVNWYERGALLFDALEHRVGRPALDRFLFRLHARDRTTALTTEELRRRILAAFGPQQRQWFDGWIEARTPTARWLAQQRAQSAARAVRLQELRFVTDKLERVYSYLEVKQKRHRFSYRALRRETADLVRRATTEAEHVAALQQLLARFHDGHLRLLLLADPRPAGPAVTHRMLPGRILLTCIARLFGDTPGIERTLRRGLARLKRARALIVDLRGNPGGNNRIAFDYVARLLSQPIVLGKSSVRLSPEVVARRPHYREIYPPDPRRPGFSTYREARIEPLAPVGFSGPIAVLVDHGCYSSCESTALAFKQIGRARLHGQPTGGGSANPIAFDLPHTRGKLQVPTWIFVKPDGELLEDNGVKPHVTLAEGEDALAAALEQIRRELAATAR